MGGRLCAGQPGGPGVRQDVAGQRDGHHQQTADGDCPGAGPVEGAAQERQVIIQDAPGKRRKDDQPGEAKAEAQPAGGLGRGI